MLVLNRRLTGRVALSLDEGVSRFIGHLYEAVYDESAWRSAMGELIKRTGSRLAFVAYADVRHREYSRTEFYGPDDSAFARGTEEYVDEMYKADPSLAWASARPNAGICDTSKMMPDDDFRRLDYARWQESRFGTVHWRVFYTRPVDDLSFALSLHPRGTDGPANAEQGLLHKILFDHMERALRLAARPPDLAGTRDAVIILDTAGHVLAMTARAEEAVNSAEGLNLTRRQLSASSIEATARLNCMIASVVKNDAIGGAGGGVRVPRKAGRADWLLLVSPYPRHLEHLPVRTPAAVLRILETDPVTITAGRAELFDLTPREAEVAVALLNGHSVDSLAQLLGISRNTAKVHLQSLFRKTATNRQSELVHLLSDLARS
jgi:DNA-binding CsgD family transcriptional regulator